MMNSVKNVVRATLKFIKCQHWRRKSAHAGAGKGLYAGGHRRSGNAALELIRDDIAK